MNDLKQTAEKNTTAENKTIRDTLYGKIDISVSTMNIICAVAIFALAAAVICGIIFR